MKVYPPLETIKSILDYDPDTGIFRWKIKSAMRIKMGQIASNKSCNGYIRISYQNQMYLAHRLAWFIYYGYLPKELDHINRNKSDNRIQNLRECTPSENGANQKSYGIVGYKGVKRSKTKGKYQAQIGHNNKQYYLGLFDTPELAALAYNKKALEFWGEFACLNEVE